MSQIPWMDAELQQSHEYNTMVLLGMNSKNKHMIGNTILQENWFGAENNMNPKLKQVDNQQIKVINTQDNFHCLIPEPETFSTEELKLSYAGPRLFLFILQNDKISDEEMKMVKQLKERFGDKIKKNTIVVMVEGEKESYGENLNKVLDKCDYRVHKMKQDTKDPELIKELLKTWNDMQKQIHESNNSASRAEHIYETVLPFGHMKQTDESKGMDSGIQPSHQHITMVLLGMKGKNKRMIGNTILQENWFGADKDMNPKVKQVNDRQIKVINTSDHFHMPISEPKATSKEELKLSYAGPRVFLLVLQDNKISDEEMKMVKQLKERFGEKMMKNTIVVMVGSKKESSRESCKRTDENLRKVLDECDSRVHKMMQDTKDPELIKELLKTWDTMQKQIHESNNSASRAELLYEMRDDLGVKNQTDKSKVENVRPPAGDHITVMLLGRNNSDKCLIGNTILETEQFNLDNVTFEMIVGKVRDQNVTIIKSPHPYHLDPKTCTDEMKPSYQGPRVFLLVLEENEMSREEHEMFNNLKMTFRQMVENTIVLRKSEKSITSHSMDKHGVSFTKDLLHECGNRVCYYDTRITHNELVKDLMKYTKEIIQKNQPLTSGEERHSEDWPVNRNQRVVHNHSLYDNSLSANSLPEQMPTPHIAATVADVAVYQEIPPTVMSHRDHFTTIVLLGQTGSGKSATGNTILGNHCFKSYASSMPVTTAVQEEEDTVCRMKIRVIDTPDFFSEDLKNQSEQLRHCKELIQHEPVVYLLVMELGRFTDGEREVLPRLKKEFGENVTTKTVILFTCKEKLKDKSLNDYIKETDQELQELIKSCQSRCCAFNNNKKSSQQVKELMQIILKMQTERNISEMKEPPSHHQRKERKNSKKDHCRIL